VLEAIDLIGRSIDAVGVITIAGGLALATALAAGRLIRRESLVYRRYRQDIGRGILLGLELLIAADIIRTVAVSPTLESVAVLAGIVLVRMALSFVLEFEVSGTWPWQRRAPDEIGRPTQAEPR
jgi:uncharacterized membrane protein